jgi:hypothetical protein
MAVLRPTVAYGNTDDGSGAGVNGSIVMAGSAVVKAVDGGVRLRKCEW